MRKILFVLILLFPTWVTAQTVVSDSVRISRHIYSFQYYDGLYHNCGAGIYSTFPDFAARIIEGETRFSNYRLVATEGQWVPNIGETLSNPKTNISVPGGHYGFLNTGGGSQGGESVYENCADILAQVTAINAGAPTLLNGQPVVYTDWYAVFDIPDGTPIALFGDAQAAGLSVDFDASFGNGYSHEVEITGKKPVSSYAWDFGDGMTGSGAQPTHAYPDIGTYNVVLAVTDDDGDVDSLRRAVTVRAGLLRYGLEIERQDYAAGETFDVTLKISNPGNETVSDVRSLLTTVSENGGEVTRLSGPTPAAIASLPAGAQSEITYQFEAKDAGTVSFISAVNGTDVNGDGVVGQVGCFLPGKVGGSGAVCTDEVNIVDGLIVNSTGDDPDQDTEGTRDAVCWTGDMITLDDGTEHGACTLRAAIQTTNENGGGRILFDIPGERPHVITLATPLDPIAVATEIDATSQSGYEVFQPVVALIAGPGATESAGLHLLSDGNAVSGLSINGFLEAGIKVEGSQNVITSNVIGRTTSGSTTQAHNIGVQIVAGSGNEIGAGDLSCLLEDAEQGNIFTGNADTAIAITGMTSGNKVTCNLIGVRPTDDRTAPNGSGITIDTPDNLVELNRIYGNEDIGVHISGTEATNNQVTGNWIGGFAEMDNFKETAGNKFGVVVESASNNHIGAALGSTDFVFNAIAGNAEADVLIYSEDPETPANANTIHGSGIGTLPDITIWPKQRAKNGKRGVVISGHASNNVIGWIDYHFYSSFIAGHKLANISILSPHATGNIINNVTIGAAQEYVGTGVDPESPGLGYFDAGDAPIGIHIEGANDVQIGALADAESQSIVFIINHEDAGIYIDGETSLRVTKLGDEAVSGMALGARFITMQTIGDFGFKNLTASSGNEHGIVVKNAENITIGPDIVMHSIIKDGVGILMENVENSTILGTKIIDAWTGIGFRKVNNSAVLDVEISKGYTGIKVDGESSGNRFGSGEQGPVFGNKIWDQVFGIAIRCDLEKSEDRIGCHDNSIQNTTFGRAAKGDELDWAISVSGDVDNLRIGGTGPADGNRFESTRNSISIRSNKFSEGITMIDYPEGTVIEGNIMGPENPSPDAVEYSAMFISDAPNTRIGGTLENSTSGMNVIRNYERGIEVFFPPEEEDGATILGNSIYNMSGVGIYRHAIFALPIYHILPYIAATRTAPVNADIKAVAIGKVFTQPNRELRVQYFRSTTCRGVNEGRELIAEETVVTDAIGIARLQEIVDLTEGDGLTVTATDVQTGHTSIFSQCYTQGTPEKVASSPITDLAAITAMELGGILVTPGGSNKMQMTDTLFVTSYDVPPLGDRYTEDTALAASGDQIIPMAAANRYWRLETMGTEMHDNFNVCLDASSLSDTDAQDAVVMQRSLATAGRWTPYDTTLETHEEVMFACAKGLSLTGEFGLGMGSATFLQSPVLVAPENELEVASHTTPLTWEPVESAVGYHVQVANTNNFAYPLVDSMEVSDTSLDFYLADPFIPYFWRVRGIDQESVWGPWSPTWSFSTRYIGVDIENEGDEAHHPSEYALEPNYPNPFSYHTTVGYRLPEPAHVQLHVFDALGRPVHTLVDQQQSAGRYEVAFDARNLSSGIYFYRIEAGSYQSVKQMLLVR